jgi:adenosylcobinamide-GDP ribazoletransferase
MTVSVPRPDRDAESPPRGSDFETGDGHRTGDAQRQNANAAGADRPEHAAPSAPSDVGPSSSSSALRSVRAAFAFFTRIPAGGFPYSDAELAWAPAHAPLVGAVLGAVLGALDVILLPLGPLAAATLVLGVSMFFTGALHEDGLADTADALGGGHDRAKLFAILKDSHIGAFGAAAIAVSVLARAALLAQLGAAALWAFPLAWCAARVGPVWLMVALPYITPSQSKSDRLVRATWRQGFVASAWFAIAAFFAQDAAILDAWRIAAVALAIAIVTAISGFRFYRRAGGITGDFLGATEQLGEIAALAACAWSA